MDLWHEFTNLLDHKRWTSAAVIAIGALTSMQVGCDATGNFMGREVTRTELKQKVLAQTADLEAQQAVLNAKAAALRSAAEAANEEITINEERQQAIFATLGDLALSVATGGAATPTLVAGGVTLGSLLLGGGALLDKKRTDKVVKKLKNGTGDGTHNSENPPAV